ncbi:unnamed protein product [Gulo gulo]|uniref:Uncharacterized protein n=1 Tax=Gulo gulo TaxID=48420 RepID=A0A9X9MBT6_GULGU|nr:unnamed protein product [Gulo gulo]
MAHQTHTRVLGSGHGDAAASVNRAPLPPRRVSPRLPLQTRCHQQGPDRPPTGEASKSFAHSRALWLRAWSTAAGGRRTRTVLSGI